MFDALTHDRVYRAAESAENALKIMQAGDGTQFDTPILAAFRAVLPQVEQVRVLYPDSLAADPGPRPDGPTEPALRVPSSRITGRSHAGWHCFYGGRGWRSRERPRRTPRQSA